MIDWKSINIDDFDFENMSNEDLLQLQELSLCINDSVKTAYRKRYDWIKVHLEPSDVDTFRMYLQTALGANNVWVKWSGQDGFVGTTHVKLTKGFKAQAQALINNFDGKFY